MEILKADEEKLTTRMKGWSAQTAQRKFDESRIKSKKLKTASDEVWEELKTGAEKTWADIKTAYHNAASKFK
jgi:hypothetical protein